MRSRSNDKYEALLKATLTLVNNCGFHDAPMSKIAKMAGISPATIYLYFENKQDLINKLYIKTKTAFSDAAFRGYHEKLSVKKGFELVWYNMADYKINNAEDSKFLSQCDNTPMIDEEVLKEGLKHLHPLIELWKRGQREGVIKPVSPYFLYAYSIYPLSFLLVKKENDVCPLTKSNLKEAFQCAWDSIKV